MNWQSINVPASEQASTLYNSFTVQNLSQDTSYEFYLRAKNIVGDGPRSEIVSARTHRAISGSLAPLNSSPEVMAIMQQPSGEASSSSFQGKLSFLPLTILLKLNWPTFKNSKILKLYVNDTNSYFPLMTLAFPLSLSLNSRKI